MKGNSEADSHRGNVLTGQTTLHQRPSGKPMPRHAAECVGRGTGNTRHCRARFCGERLSCSVCGTQFGYFSLVVLANFSGGALAVPILPVGPLPDLCMLNDLEAGHASDESDPE